VYITSCSLCQRSLATELQTAAHLVIQLAAYPPHLGLERKSCPSLEGLVQPFTMRPHHNGLKYSRFEWGDEAEELRLSNRQAWLTLSPDGSQHQPSDIIRIDHSSRFASYKLILVELIRQGQSQIACAWVWSRRCICGSSVGKHLSCDLSAVVVTSLGSNCCTAAERLRAVYCFVVRHNPLFPSP
jgi:hypothetical protein